MRWVDATDLEQWANRRDSQALLPELLRQLVYATVPDARRVEIRTGEGVQLSGMDGYVEASTGTIHVPLGVSCWELGTGRDITSKANSDYETRTADPLGVVTSESAFVFVTPRRWKGKAAWVQAKQAEAIWREVRAHDADDLDSWLQHAPSVGAWLARRIDKYPARVASLDDVWSEFSSTTKPPLTTELVLAGRETVQGRVAAWLHEAASILHVKADTPAEAIGFVAAHIMALPVEERDRLRARTLATSEPETLRALATTRAPLLLLYSNEQTAVAGIAIQRGHHVLIPLQPGQVVSTDDIGLPRPSREAFAAALSSMGFEKEESIVIARETGRSITAFQRRFAVARPPAPLWANPPHVHDVVTMLFAGSWDDQRPADRDLLVELTGRTYADVAQFATAFTLGTDPPLRQAGSVYAFAAVRDAWLLVGRYVTRESLARFAMIAERVLSLEDPRLTLPPNERWLSALRGLQHAHSEELREGIARSLVLLSVLGNDGLLPHRLKDIASDVVGRVLAPDVPWQRWYSVGGVLTLLAEAAPQAFLAGLQAQLAPATPSLVRLFEEEGGGISSNSMHTHLLWALEILAWDPLHLGTVTLLLGRLAQVDPGGSLQNRPINSLREIFLYWHPYTSATLVQRKQALELLISRAPDVAWELVSRLLPKTFDHGKSTAQPQWRIVAPRNPMTYGERNQGAIHILETALTLAGSNARRLELLVKECGTWPSPLRDQLAGQLRAFSAEATPEDRTVIWAALRELVNSHRSHPTADWATPTETLAPLAAVRDLLIPEDLTSRYAWLFNDWCPNLGEPRGDDHVATEADVTRARQDALREILQSQGQEGVIKIAGVVKYPGFVGRDTADIVEGEPEQRDLLIATLGSATESVRILGQALVTRWQARRGEAWVDTMLALPLTSDDARTTGFLLGLPFGRPAWDRVATFAADVGEHYWREVQVWLPQGVAADDLMFAVHRLVEHRRPFVAMHLLSLHIESASSAVLLLVLDAVRNALIVGEELPPTQRLAFDLERIMERLDAVGVGEADIGRLEWFFLPVLSHGTLTPTLNLHRRIASDPTLFADIISALYSADRRTTDEDPPPTEQESARAVVASQLLSSWHIVPGSTPEHGIDSVVLNAWVDGARERCLANGLEASGDRYIGEILAHAPVDEDGVWPHRAVRDTIERLASQGVESGVAVAIFNGRGVVRRAPASGGDEERALAAHYRGYADALALTHPRTAELLRRIAEGYERHGRFEDELAEQRDLD